MNVTRYSYEKTNMSWKKNIIKKTAARNLHVKKCCIVRIPWMSEFSPIEFLKGVVERVTKAVCFSSMRRSSNRVSASMGRSKTIGVSVDYFRTAAVEDCIEFFHIQSSFSRSNSLTITPQDEFTRFSERKFDS